MDVNSNQNYHDQQNIENINKMRDVLDTLPKFCKQFFRGIAYRVGGDEFTVFAKDKTLEEIKELAEEIEETAAKNREQSGSTLTMSIGYAKFDPQEDRNFAKTIERSDNMMYENKRMFYQKKNMNIR